MPRSKALIAQLSRSSPLAVSSAKRRDGRGVVIVQTAPRVYSHATSLRSRCRRFRHLPILLIGQVYVRDVERAEVG